MFFIKNFLIDLVGDSIILRSERNLVPLAVYCKYVVPLPHPVKHKYWGYIILYELLLLSFHNNNNREFVSFDRGMPSRGALTASYIDLHIL